MSIIVTSQEQLDKIPLDTDEQIIIKFGTPYNRAVVKNKYRYRVVAWGNSSVEARENSSVEAMENSSVVARENSSVVAWGNSSVVARGNSSVVARENSSVVAWGNSSVEAMENSSVEARENSSVVAWGNSSVVAWGNSSVEASGNTQIVDRTRTHKIKTSANSRIIYMPKSIHEFMDFYGIKHTKKKATFYKAVHNVEGKYISNHDDEFEYVIGKVKKNDDINTDVNDDCGRGIHISHLAWAVDYGRNWSDLAIIEVEVAIDDIVMPINTNGKVRVQQVKVLREVPLSECGLLGKILDKKRSKEE